MRNLNVSVCYFTLMEWVLERRAYAPKSRLATLQSFALCERVKGVHNTTVMAWVEEVAQLLPNAYAPETIPQVGELDELETNISDVPRAKLWKSQRLLLVRKKQNLALDRSRPFSTRYFRLGVGQP